MTYCSITSAVLAIGCAAALHGQTPTGNQTNRTTPDTVTLTGCIERADQVAGNAALGTTVDSLSFMLIKATKGSAAEARPTATTGAAGNAETGSMYWLNAETSKLNPHVGHRVEVTGRIDVASAPKASSADGTTTAANAQTVRVETIKMVSETCGR